MELVSIRRASADDLEFLVDLFTDEDVQPFLAAVRARDGAGVRALVERSEREPELYGLFVVEVDGERAGTMEFEVVNRRSAIASIGGLAVHPRFRGRRVGDEAARLFQRHLLLERGLHRLQLEVYGFNERAIAHAERVGFVREGVKRRAYRRGDGWVDGVMFSLLREDLDPSPPAS
jgi:RimJ/RimL family protein N-acetyltransferase